jgi:Kef-type K+ transport system membrane component KefB
VLTLLLAVSGHGGAAQMASTVGITLALVIFMVWCVRPALAAYIRFVEKRGVADRLLLPVLIAVAIAAAGATGMIGLHPVIGAFLAGVIVPRRPAVEAIGRQLRGFVLIILLPLFFAGIGLSTSIGIVFASPAGWLVFLAVFVVAIVTKFLGAGGAARLNGFPAAQAVGLGALMNCRGVTELIVASIGLQAGLVSRVGFNVLVLVALITSMVTMPTVRKFIPEARRGRGDPSITRPAGP